MRIFVAALCFGIWIGASGAALGAEAEKNVYTEFYGNGAPRVRWYYKEGEIVAKKEYYENRKLKSERHYKGGQLHGVVKDFYKNGNPKLIMHYEADLLHGKWEEYYKNGNLKSERHYQNGALHGELKKYRPDGSLKESRTYKEGMLQ